MDFFREMQSATVYLRVRDCYNGRESARVQTRGKRRGCCARKGESAAHDIDGRSGSAARFRGVLNRDAEREDGL